MDEQKSRIERLQQKIDSQNYHAKNSDFELHKKDYNIKADWGDNNKPNNSGGFNNEQEPERKGYGFKIFLGVAFLFFILSIAYAGLIFVRDNQVASGDDVTINVVGPISIGGGEKLSLDVLVQNNNPVPIEFVDLIVDYPEGTKQITDLVTDLKRDRSSVGTIAAGALIRKTVSSALFGEENATKEINVTVEYRVQGASAIFAKKKSFDIVLNASPIRMTVGGLREISAGQDLEMELKITSNSTKRLENVAISAEYPFGFTFKDSNIKATDQNNFWVFDFLNPSEEKIIKIKGTVQGQNEEDRIFKFKSGILKTDSSNELGVIFNTASHELVIQKSFVDLALSINDIEGKDFIVGSGQDVDGKLSFTNNTNDIIRDLRIELEIVGTALNKSTVNVSDGFYSSSENKITWNSQNSQNFSEIGPRDNFVLPFRFKTQNLASGSISATNPIIRLKAGVTGIRVSTDSVEEKIETIASANLKVATDASVKTYTAYEGTQFVNYGPVPPKADLETSYTVVFEVSNNTNSLKNARIETIIPIYVSYKNLFSPESSNVSFDPVTRKLVWDIGDISIGEGYTKPSRKFYLNLVLKPSVSQIGSAPDLIKNTKFTALDTFTNTNVESFISSATTKILGRPIGNKDENVVE